MTTSTSILMEGLKLIFVKYVEKCAVIKATLESTLKTFIFLAFLSIIANIVIKHLILETCCICTFPKCIRLMKDIKYLLTNLIFIRFLGEDMRLFYEYIIKDPSTGPKSHKCTLCGKVGNDRGNLRKHVENIHFPGSFSYSCKYCAETFTTRNNLNMHISKNHNRGSC